MNSTVKKRSIVIGSHKTSISLEDIFWTCLKEIARERRNNGVRNHWRARCVARARQPLIHDPPLRS
jgi:hypothetical protein